jgi:hypothetical protein
MKSHVSLCPHDSFCGKSSPEQTWVLRHVTGRLTVHRLVNVNPGRPRTSSTATPRKPQHHRLRSPRSESKSFFFLKCAQGIVKRAIQEAGREEVSPPPPRCRRPRRQGEAAPARGREAASAQGGAAAHGGRACSSTKC